MFSNTDLFIITIDVTILNPFAIAVWFAQTCPPSTILIRSKFNLFVSIDIPSIRPRYNTSNPSETIALHHAQRWYTDSPPDRRTYALYRVTFQTRFLIRISHFSYGSIFVRNGRLKSLFSTSSIQNNENVFRLLHWWFKDFLGIAIYVWM